VVQVEYVKDKTRKKSERKLSALYIMGRGKIQWTDNQLAAAFVTADNPGIESLARESVKQWYARLQQANLDDPIGRAILMFDVIGKMGIIYNPDPNTPYQKVGRDSRIFDHIQYPSQLLKSKIGDCDDCSVLMSALLENLGISTCLLDVTDPDQGHLFMMFDTGIPLEQASSRFISPDEYIPYQGRAWIPIEVTQFGRSFQEAYRYGMQEYRRCRESGYLKIVDVGQSRRIYQAGQVEPAEWNLPSPPSVDSLLCSDLNWFNQRYTAVCRLERPMTRPEDYYEAGTCLLNYQQLDSAAPLLLQAIRLDSTLADAHNALGVIHTRNRNYPEAEASIKRAIELEPDNYGFKINLAILFHLIGNKEAAQHEIQSIPADSYPIPEELLKSP